MIEVLSSTVTVLLAMMLSSVNFELSDGCGLLEALSSTATMLSFVASESTDDCDVVVVLFSMAT